MRLVRSTSVLMLSIMFSLLLCGQASAQFTITNYVHVGEQQVTRTMWNETYSASLVNSGPALASVTATLTSLNTNSFTVATGQGTLNFGPVPANSTVTSSNTFTILVNRTVTFDSTFSQLQWTFKSTTIQPPVANAGASQIAKVGGTVTLNGSASTNPSGIGTLTYSWAFMSKPAGSGATLNNPNSVTPTFVVDVPGNYVITLTVSNGAASNSANTTVSTNGVAPVANAGPAQMVKIGSTVTLNGTGSTDAEGNPLTYAWTLTGVPTGSAATLTNPNTAMPTFVADKVGNYTAQLIVNNGFQSSSPATVTISDSDVAPVANAGVNQKVNVGDLVQLNGSGSTDVGGYPLTYAWSFNALPTGSHATLSNPTAVNPTFTADVTGTYVVQLIVNDGFLPSNASTVMISTNTVAPTANAGPNQTVGHNMTVQLSGSGTDPQGLPLTYAWSLLAKPTGSTATLSSTTIANPTFFADKPGLYTAQLIVNDGVLNSAASTVNITTTNSPPVANAGSPQNVKVGQTVTLDGSGSTDADKDPITYAWSLITLPSGSTATLTGANTVSPMFVADVAGNYVAQLTVSDPYSTGSTATVMITAVNNNAVTLSPNPLNVPSGGTATLTVKLAAPATTAQTINLSASPSGVVTVPSSVTIAANTTGANVTVTAVGTGSTTITGSASGITSGTATVNVLPALTITTSSLANGVAGAAYSASVSATGGTTPYSWSATGLPAGLSINASTGAITGTPTAAATTSASITVTDSTTGNPFTATKSLSITIIPTLSITSTSPLSNGVMNQAYSATVTATGGVTPYAWSATGLPAGLSINAATGAISGTPTGQGASNASVTVKDSGTPQQTANASLSITINTGLTITTTSVANGIVNQAYSAAVSATGGVTPLIWSATGLPAGLSINASTGAITGTPTSAGTTQATITAKDSGTPQQTATQNLSISIIPTLSITTTSLSNGVMGQAYSSTVAATGGVTPYAWSATGLPAGLSINPTTGAITGTPTGSGPSSVSITVKDGGTPQQTVSASFTINVTTGLTITTTSLANGIVGQGYTATVAASGGTTPYSWSATGLPAGLSINATTGAITGTPTAAATSTAAITVKDSTTPQQTATANLSITITAPLSITTTSLASGVTGSAYSAAVAATGGTTPYAWSATGLPAGLSINPTSGAITGTPSAAASSTAAITVKDGSTPQQTATANLSITIVAPLSITTTSLASGVTGVAYSANVAATGGTTPYAWSATSLPAGLSINATTGVISGTPTGSGATAAITVKDSSSPQQTATANLSITINPALSITTTTLPNGVAGAGYTATVAASNGVTPLSWSATGLPTGLSINASSGVISGTTTVSGPVTALITVKDSGTPQQTATKSLSFSIIPALGITTTSLANGMVGAAYSAPIAVTGGVTPYAFSASLPPGLSINVTTGAITGTPTTAATSTAVVTVKDSGSPQQTATANLSITITGSAPVCSGITVSSISIGLNLQAELTITVPTAPAAGSGGLGITITSSNAAVAAMNTSGGLVGSINATIPELQNSIGVNIQALQLGTANFAVTAPATSAMCTGTVTVTNSGFILVGPNGAGTPNFTTNQGQTTPLTVYAEQLDANGNPVANQSIRTGVTVSVPLSSSSKTVGTVPATVSFTGGDLSQSVNFTALASGASTLTTTTLAVGVPTGFTAPASQTQVTANVNPIGCSIVGDSAAGTGLTVGNNLETSAYVKLQGSASSPFTITLTSNSSTLLLSTDGNSAGSSSINLMVSAGAARTPDFYIYGAGSSGSPTFTANCGTFGNATGTATLLPAGFVLQGPGFPSQITTTAPGIPVGLTVQAVMLDANLDAQSLAGGLTANVPITVNSTPTSGVGTVSPTPVTILGGQANGGNGLTTFTPTGAGTAIVSVTQPSGFQAPASNTSETITVNTLRIIGCGSQDLGFGLQVACGITLSGRVTGSPLTVTFTSNSPNLVISSDPTKVGTQIATISIPVGSQTGQVYLQATASSGTATVTVTAPGYTAGANNPSTITFVQTGLILYDQFVNQQNATISKSFGPQSLNVVAYQFDETGNPSFVAQLGPTPIAITINNSNPSAGTVTFSTTAVQPTFTPLTVGQSTTLTLQTPPGFASPVTLQNAFTLQPFNAQMLNISVTQ